MGIKSGRTPDQLKVSELKEELKSRGLTVGGLKKDLVERLRAAISDEQGENEVQENLNAEEKSGQAELSTNADVTGQESYGQTIVPQMEQETGTDKSKLVLDNGLPLSNESNPDEGLMQPSSLLSEQLPAPVVDPLSGTFPPTSVSPNDFANAVAQQEEKEAILNLSSTGCSGPIGVSSQNFESPIPELPAHQSSLVESEKGADANLPEEPPVNSSNVRTAESNLDTLGEKLISNEDDVDLKSQSNVTPVIDSHGPDEDSQREIAGAGAATKGATVPTGESVQKIPVQEPVEDVSTRKDLDGGDVVKRLDNDNLTVSNESLKGHTVGGQQPQLDEQQAEKIIGPKSDEGELVQPSEPVGLMTDPTSIDAHAAGENGLSSTMGELEGEGIAEVAAVDEGAGGRSQEMEKVEEPKVREEEVAFARGESGLEGRDNMDGDGEMLAILSDVPALDAEEDSGGEKKGEDADMDVDGEIIAGKKRTIENVGIEEESKSEEPAKRQRKWASTGDIGKAFMPAENSRDDTVAAENINSEEAGTMPAAGAIRAQPKLLAGVQNAAPSGALAKDRVVPPPTEDPTPALRINNFVRPFTQPALRELLAQTGTVVKFWMDAIRTHCYVLYASVEEASITRTALYNLQWPERGGKLLFPSFVDPAEVDARLEAPPAGAGNRVPNVPASSNNVGAAVNKASAGLGRAEAEDPAQSAAVASSKGLSVAALPAGRVPAAAISKEPEPALPTLDDLFRKTKAKPHIYYLPLSEDQVAAKLAVQNKGQEKPPRI